MLLETLAKDKWKRIGLYKRAGILVPLFSVYSKDSVGIGDFADLKLLVDFAVKTGSSIIQILPMNEVGATFCPYDSLSAFALEPFYISLNHLSLKNKFRNDIEALKNKFPTDARYIDYNIKPAKIELLRKIFSLGAYKDCNAKDFKAFCSQNAYWLENFAFYKVIKALHQGKPWYEWEEPYKHPNASDLNKLIKSHKEEIDFQMWLQWVGFSQFKDAHTYASSKKILLKGDLPILVSRDSADVWQRTEFFKLEYAAGAPPDMYCAKGQRWGMPTYNWERIAGDGFTYLKEKLKYAGQFYDMIRVDHVAGLFRIWSIPYNEPEENQGLNGFFDPGDESKWVEQGEGILTVIINSTKMLICAEDLGIIPADCPKTLEKLGIPGNDVQRWVKDWKVRHNFLKADEYRYLSVTMLSTHDTTNAASWWENEAGTVDEALFKRKCSARGIGFSLVKDRLFNFLLSKCGRLRWLDSVDSVDTLVSILGKGREELSDFIDLYENTFQEKEKMWELLGLSGSMREKCDKEIIRAILRMNLEARSIFSIQLVWDWLFLSALLKENPYAYRINFPGTVAKTNWALRIPVSLEALLDNEVCTEMRSMIAASGRR